MIFRLTIVDLIVYMCIGIYDWEKVVKQKVLVSIDLLHSRKEKSKVIDYKVLTAKVMDFLTSEGYDFLENAAEGLITYIMEEIQEVTEGCVQMHKPMASFMCSEKTVVSVTRRRTGYKPVDKPF